MRSKQVELPSPLQSQILGVLWRQGGRMTVREISQALYGKQRKTRSGRQREISRGILNTLVWRGMVTQTAQKRQHYYAAACKEVDVKGDLIKRFIEQGPFSSAFDLVTSCVKTKLLSAVERKELRTLLGKRL